MYIIKKDKTSQQFDINKVIKAISKSAYRCLYTFTPNELEFICKEVQYKAEQIASENDGAITIENMHSIVEVVLDKIQPSVAKSYRDYRNYKVDFCEMLDKIYRKSQNIRYIGDVSNANSDSSMVSTQRSLIYGHLNKELYQKFFLNKEERQAINDGYIYIHDMKDRLDGVNCCLADIRTILKNGFEMGNLWYNEPKTLDAVMDVIADIVISSASQQYGGYTIPEVDKLLKPYAEKSYELYCQKFDELYDLIKSLPWIIEDIHSIDYDLYNEVKHDFSMKQIRRDFEQGFQAWEYKFNSIGSSRGDYPFVSISFGVGTDDFEVLASSVALQVRKNGQGKKGYKKPVLFPKITFLYDENLHGIGKEFEWLFDEAVECSSKSMYPDFLSLTGEGYIPSIYKKYGKVISLMGCRASLSPWFVRGGMEPADENDEPVFVGRCNLGAISLHLPMILAKARQENKDFYEVLDYYLELIRNLHKKTYAYLGEKKASTNPVMFMQGGFLGGTLEANDKILPLLKPMTMSFGVTALNELQQLYNEKSLVEDQSFALDVMKYINEKVDQFKHEDDILYAIYGTPAESLCGLQVKQFRAKYGIVKNVSDREYVSNSFHCGVWEDITPIQKQDLERNFWDYFNGGKIQYCKYPIDYNIKAIKVLIRRAMEMGFYEGVNLSLAYCENCGYEELEMHICPNCDSDMITEVDRMNGYIAYTKVHGKSRYNEAKLAEIRERVSM